MDAFWSKLLGIDLLARSALYRKGRNRIGLQLGGRGEVEGFVVELERIIWIRVLVVCDSTGEASVPNVTPRADNIANDVNVKVRHLRDDAI